MKRIETYRPQVPWGRRPQAQTPRTYAHFATYFLLLLGVLTFAVTVAAQTITNLADNTGPVMQFRTAFLIFWLPPGFHYDATNTAAADTTYETLMARFFTDMSGSTYLNIISQYPGLCGPPAISSGAPCLGPITVGGTTVDTRAYATGTGTAANPLRDLDIQTEIATFMTSKGITPDQTMGFFVFLGAGAVECFHVGACSGGNFPVFCAYHSSFSTASGTAAYAVMPNVDSLGAGCDSITTAPNQLASDRETVALSHEFAEMITDPLPTNNAWLALDGSEVGDLCNFPYFSGPQLGPLAANGSNATFNGHALVLQQLWSNDDESCITTSVSSFTGPTSETIFMTGSHGLSSGNGVAGVLQAQDGSSAGVLAKSPNTNSWDSSSLHVRVSRNSLTSPVQGELLTMSGGGSWDIQSIDLKLRNANGSIICEELQNGTPLQTLSSGHSITFPTPNCLPPPPPQEAVVCSVFDDGGSNLQGPTDAIFISGRSTNNEQGKACMPGGQFGVCRKWFGQCQTVTTNAQVTFNVFDDGGANLAGPSGAVYIPKNGNQACIPDNTSTGTCRRWFGSGTTSDGRQVSCIVFDDGYANPSTASGAIYIPHPIPSGGSACIPDNTSSGLCRRWFGRCVAQ